MPVNITITIADEDLAKVASALLGGTKPGLTDKTSPPAVSDKKADKKADKRQEQAAAEAEAAAAQQEPTTDLVTEKQKEQAEATAKETGLDDIRAQLTDYYVGQGSSKKEVQNAIASMGEEELRSAYLDYLARLVRDEDGEFTEDFETPYIATRIDDGAEIKRWVVGGVTLTDEQVAEKKLADPNAKAAPKKPGLPMRKK